MYTYFINVSNLQQALENTEPDLALNEIAEDQEIITLANISVIDIAIGTIELMTFEEVSPDSLVRIEAFFAEELNNQ